MLYYPTNIVPKSKLVVWLFFVSMMYLEWSTEVAWISIESLTRIDSDFSLIDPLKIPASDGLYFTVKKVSSLGLIFRCLGYTDSIDPCSWVNSIAPGAFPLFLIGIFSRCSLPILRKPISIKGSNSIWLSILYTLTGNSTVIPSSLMTLMIYVSFFSYLHSYLILAVVDSPGAISGCMV